MRRHSSYSSLEGKLQPWVWPILSLYKQTCKVSLRQPKLPEAFVSQAGLIISLTELNTIFQLATHLEMQHSSDLQIAIPSNYKNTMSSKYGFL